MPVPDMEELPIFVAELSDGSIVRSYASIIGLLAKSRSKNLLEFISIHKEYPNGKRKDVECLSFMNRALLGLNMHEANGSLNMPVADNYNYYLECQSCCGPVFFLKEKPCFAAIISRTGILLADGTEPKAGHPIKCACGHVPQLYEFSLRYIRTRDGEKFNYANS